MHGGLRNQINKPIQPGKLTEKAFRELKPRYQKAQTKNNDTSWRFIQCQKLLTEKGIEPSWSKTCILFNWTYEDQVSGPSLPESYSVSDLNEVLQNDLGWDELEELGAF